MIYVGCRRTACERNYRFLQRIEAEYAEPSRPNILLDQQQEHLQDGHENVEGECCFVDHEGLQDLREEQLVLLHFEHDQRRVRGGQQRWHRQIIRRGHQEREEQLQPRVR